MLSSGPEPADGLGPNSSATTSSESRSSAACKTVGPRSKAKNAQRSMDRVRKAMRVFKGECGHHTRGVLLRKLWSALHEIDRYLRGQSAWLVNYAERHRAGLHVGPSITEGTVNFLVNRRMNKSQQMRTNRNRCDSPGEASIFCSRSAARCTTGRSGQGSAIGLRCSSILR